MSLKNLALKARIMAPRLLLSLLLIIIGSVLLTLPQYQQILSETISWLETEGIRHSLAIGVAALFIGVWMFASSLQQLFTHRITYTKGPLLCSVKNKLLDQTVQQLWLEYFERPDLQANVSLRGGHITITGEAPEGWDNAEELSTFLSQRLLSYTGYWGDLLIHTTPVAKGSSKLFT
jgi:hypothetical protein